jgi:hypothetical protein
MGHIECVREFEATQGKQGNIRASRLENLYSNCGRVIDEYRIVSWPIQKQILAGEVLDKVHELIRKAFYPKSVGRDEKGRFIALS